MPTTNRPSSTAEDPWGSHRAVVTERLSICADFLGRLERSLSGEAAPDRLYFSMKALALYEAARDLVRLTESVEHWLIVCDAPLIHLDPVRPVEAFCELPRNHLGGQDDQPVPSLAVQVRNNSRLLMDEAEMTARWVNRLGLEADQAQAFEIEREFDPEVHELFEDLQRRGGVLLGLAKKVDRLLEELVYAVPQEEWDEFYVYEEDDEDLDSFGTGDFVIEEPVVPLPPVRRARGLDL